MKNIFATLFLLLPTLILGQSIQRSQFTTNANPGNTVAVTMTNAANSFAGNGSGLTGVSATATNAIANNNGSGTNLNVYGVGGNIVTNGAGFFQGGAPLQLDLQGSGMQLNGQLWGALKRPWKILYTGQARAAGDYCNETNALYMMNWVNTNGMAAALTNDGSKLAIWFETGWDASRNTNWAYTMTNMGSLTWDTNRFPHGIPWFCAAAHSNNFKVIMMIYSATNLPPAGASSMCESWDGGGGLVAITNGVSIVPTNVYGHYNVVTTPDRFQSDMQELTWWGLDGVCSADNPSIPQGLFQVAYGIGRSLLQVARPAGFNQAVGTTYWTANWSALDPSWPNQWWAPMPISIFDPWRFASHPPVYIAYETAVYQNYTLGFQDIGDHTGAYYDNNGQGFGAAGLRNIYKDYPGQQKTSQGAYVMFIFATSQADAVATALVHGLSQSPVFSYPYAGGGAGWTQWALFETNMNWSAIHQDPAQNWPTLYDYGTNVGSIWPEQLASGSYAVGIFNEGATTNTFTVNWTNHLFWPADKLVHVREIYPLSVDLGTNSGTFSQYLTAGDSILLKFDPLTPLQTNNTAGSSMIFTNALGVPFTLQVNSTTNGFTFVSQAAAAWTPASLPNLASWWVMENVTTNGGVLTVTNLSSNNWPLTNVEASTKWPTNFPAALNGHGYLGFGTYSASGYSYLYNQAFTLNQPDEVTIVYRPKTGAVPNAYSYIFTDTAGDVSLRGHYTTTTNLEWSCSGWEVMTSGLDFSGKWRMDTLQMNGASSQYLTNNVTALAANSGTANMAGFILNGTTALYWPMNEGVAEIICYSAQNSSTNLALLYNYVTNKYGAANFQ